MPIVNDIALDGGLWQVFFLKISQIANAPTENQDFADDVRLAPNASSAIDQTIAANATASTASSAG